MRTHLPLKALRAFECAARHLSFTLAAKELSVTQAAVSQQVRILEQHLGKVLFKRLSRSLTLTDEGRALLPVLSDAFDRMERVLQQFESGHFHEVLTVGVIGTFAVGWLLPRLDAFGREHPFVELRLLTHNNQVDLIAEGLDCAIRFGDGLWPGGHHQLLMPAPLSPLCSPAIALRLNALADLAAETLLRSYRADDWRGWLRAAQLDIRAPGGPVFDSSRLMVEAAMQGSGVALAPPCMFERELKAGLLVRPFPLEVDVGGYWLTHVKARPPSAALQLFRSWVTRETARTAASA